MATIRKHGAAPILILVPAVAGMYLTAGCGLPESPTAVGTTSTTTSFAPATTPQPLAPATSTAAATTTDSGDSEYAAVCADAVTGARVEDTECDRATETYTGDDNSAAGYAAAGLAGGVAGAAMWYYFSTRNRVVAPPIGARVGGGSYTTPTSYSGRTPVVYRAGSVDSRGGRVTSGTIMRGGLGSRDHSGS
ncbi:hypothetical protein AB0L57_06175 [Nocardia sp. NPDC052254]|uniref:hypothetical protein n=1 Tax=Nocardia sp. NPDC052254 TaxID=3155681 RepID=UPI003430EAE4